MTTACLRRASGEALVRLGAELPELIVLEADISKSTRTDLFHAAFPGRFYNVGIAEANMVGVAAGMATMGLRPVCSTYAVFLSMRACETIRQSVCYARLPVIFVGTHGGLATGPDGVSHQAIEDIAIFRTLPNTVVLVPADAPSVYAAYHAALGHQGPAFIRLMRDPGPVIPEAGGTICLGKARVLAEGTDVTLWACGIMTAEALAARVELHRGGISARVVDSPSVKPLDIDLLLDCARRTGAIVSCEDGLINGGLGSAVSEALGERLPTPMRRIGLDNTFGETGTRAELFRHYGMDSAAIARAVRELLHAKGAANGIHPE